MDSTTTLHHEFGYVRDAQVFLKGYLEYPDRQIGIVKETEEASLMYFEKRFDIAKNKVAELEHLILEAQNKGSYLMKLIHMKKYLSEFDGLGDFISLFNKLDELENVLRDLISVNRVKNLEIKQSLLNEIQEIIDTQNFAETTDTVREIKLKWIKTGSVPPEVEENLEESFNEAIRNYFELKKEFFKNRSKSIKDNLRNYKIILDQAEYLRDSDDFDKAFATFRDLQQKWKTAGKVPHSKATELWERFKKLNDYFFVRYKNYKSYKEKYPELDAIAIKNTEQKKLCFEAEDLVNSDKEEASERAKELLMDWKKLTSTFRNIDDEFFNRFRNACDKVFEYGYLMRVVKRKYPNIDVKPREDKLRIKTSFMRELIRRDEQEYQLAETNVQKTLAGAKNNKEDNREQMTNLRLMQNNLQVQKRKIQVKRNILTDLEDELRNIKKTSY